MATQNLKTANVIDNRKFPRTDVQWSGTLETGGQTLDCTVLNLSANGAKLLLNDPISGNSWSGVLSIPSLGSFQAKVAWSTPKGSNEIGLTFQDPPAAVALVLAEALPRTREQSVG
jgi:hypothetical protein